MIIPLLYDLVLVVGISVLAHAAIAYVLAPKKAKQGILDALMYDETFQTSLTAQIVSNFLKPVKLKNKDGETIEDTPINIFSKIASGHIEGWMKSWIGGQQSQLVQDLEKNAQESMAIMPNNPLMALAMAQIPKKYLPYAQILANLLVQNQQP